MGKREKKVAVASAAPRKELLLRGRSVSIRHMKKKANSKPDCLNEQEIPYRLREIMRSRDELRNPTRKKKKKAANKQRPQSEGDIPVPKFKRRRGETETSYNRRMDREIEHVRFLTENQTSREPEKEMQVQEKSQRKKEFQKKRLEKIRKQKVEKKITMLEKDLLKDSVKFGEVALQPPTLTVKPRKSVIKDKADQRQQLLLTSLLGSGREATVKKPVHASLARQRIIQEERERVVQAYRDIKKRKQQQQQQQLNKSFLVVDKLKKPA
ncbi:coiled-coil domain-containing protein 137 isoform X1 [Protobothrops mucrosquamatus]|uniref:coiled-coil domain-containing protein 137 isoform X1 n=1 Tax=Protobothrops mucrosquamatus TaxID=103944 RepID=UPI0010FBAA9C|nr:coiled-coil domain-containing protein 137 isoform X1 [Protobothrops mucrosquamatus]